MTFINIIFIAILGITFLVSISIQIIHWLGYLYSRYSKDLELQRKFIRHVTKIASKPYPQKFKPKKEDKDNPGYA